MVKCGDKVAEKKADFKEGKWALHTIVHQLLEIAVAILIDYVYI